LRRRAVHHDRPVLHPMPIKACIPSGLLPIVLVITLWYVTLGLYGAPQLPPTVAFTLGSVHDAPLVFARVSILQARIPARSARAVVKADLAFLSLRVLHTGSAPHVLELAVFVSRMTPPSRLAKALGSALFRPRAFRAFLAFVATRAGFIGSCFARTARSAVTARVSKLADAVCDVILAWWALAVHRTWQTVAGVRCIEALGTLIGDETIAAAIDRPFSRCGAIRAVAT